MKIVTYLLGALLAAAIGAAALFYFTAFQPMASDYARMKAGLPELDRAKAELKKYKDRESREAGWIAPAADELSRGLADEIQAGKAEVTATGCGVLINIAEEKLYTPHSVTFGKDSRPFLDKVAGLLSGRNLKGKEIMIANTTDTVPAQGKGRKRTPPRDARSLAADRSLAFVKLLLDQNKVDQESVVAGAYGAKMPEAGFKIKDHKMTILIENQPSPAATAAPALPKPGPAPAIGGHEVAPKTIPLRPAQPKTK